jgi:TolB-like protein
MLRCVRRVILAVVVTAGTSAAVPAYADTPRAFMAWEAATNRGERDIVDGLASKEGLHVRVAVLPFTARDGATCEAGQAIAEDLARALAQHRHPSVDGVVDRASVALIEQEQKLSHSDLADPAAAAKLGKLAGATAIVTGSFGSMPGGYAVSMKLVSVETGALLSAASVRVDGDDVASRGGCGIPAPVTGQGATEERVYGRQTFAHKLFLYTSVTGFATAVAAGTVAIVGFANVAQHCDENHCDQRGADWARYGRVAGFITDGALALGVVALGIHFLIPPANPGRTGVRVLPPEGGIIGGRF